MITIATSYQIVSQMFGAVQNLNLIHWYSADIIMRNYKKKTTIMAVITNDYTKAFQKAERQQTKIE